MINKKKNNKGFTLVELLVVIAIIGILAVVAVPALFKNINKAKVADLESDYSAIKSAVLSYYTDENTFPIDEIDEKWNEKLANYMDSVPTNSPIDGTYSIVKENISSNNDIIQVLALKITGAKATQEQVQKLINDIGSEKVCEAATAKATATATIQCLTTAKEINGDIYLILIDNTNM